MPTRTALHGWRRGETGHEALPYANRTIRVDEVLQRETWRSKNRTNKTVCVVTHQLPLMNGQKLIYYHIWHELADALLITYNRMLCLSGVWGE